jgi:integral membrane protein (TIGR01906 family)|tara:strand:+ start:4129 stop:4869 length:741 start_codon:yes stop_codon:yes gene_type:complete
VRRVAWIPAALFVVAVPLFLVTTSVTWAFNSAGAYERGFEKYGVSGLTGITRADLVQVAADIRHYFNSREEPMAVRTRIFGEERDLFNSREVSHMRDVKRLIWGVYIIAALSTFYLLAAAGLGLARYRRRFAETLARRCLWGGGVTLALILAVGLFALVGFDRLFLTFHQLSFSNDLWQLDWRTDYLVRLFPQNFWFDSTMWVATRAVAGALAVTVLSGGYLLYLRRAAQKGVLAPRGELSKTPGM